MIDKAVTKTDPGNQLVMNAPKSDNKNQLLEKTQQVIAAAQLIVTASNGTVPFAQALAVAIEIAPLR